jgi:hypothetical protein
MIKPSILYCQVRMTLHPPVYRSPTHMLAIR